MATINSIKRVEIFPSNRSSTTNSWSYRDGNPTLVFNFGVQDMYLMSDTLRLNFKLRLNTSAIPTTFPNNNNATGAGAVEVLLNNKIGAMSVFQNITISNAQNQNLEYVRNFSRLLASLIPARANFGDYSTILQQHFGATSNKQAQGMICNNYMEVSAPLMCGMFLMGDPIPLGMNGTGGLQIKLQLTPSIEANYGAQGPGSYYSIEDPSITCAMGVPAGGTLPRISAYPYLNYSSYYGVLNNSDETHNIQMNLSSVLSVFNNFVPTQFIANNTQDGNATLQLQNSVAGPAFQEAPINRYTTLRGGMKYPYQFSVDERRNITIGATGVQVSTNQAQLIRNFLSSISSPIKDLNSTLTGNISENTQAAGPLLPIEDQHYNSQGENVIGVGTRNYFDKTTGNQNMRQLLEGLPNDGDGVPVLASPYYTTDLGTINWTWVEVCLPLYMSGILYGEQAFPVIATNGLQIKIHLADAEKAIRISGNANDTRPGFMNSRWLGTSNAAALTPPLVATGGDRDYPTLVANIVAGESVVANVPNGEPNVLIDAPQLFQVIADVAAGATTLDIVSFITII